MRNSGSYYTKTKKRIYFLKKLFRSLSLVTHPLTCIHTVNLDKQEAGAFQGELYNHEPNNIKMSIIGLRKRLQTFLHSQNILMEEYVMQQCGIFMAYNKLLKTWFLNLKFTFLERKVNLHLYLICIPPSRTLIASEEGPLEMLCLRQLTEKWQWWIKVALEREGIP